MLYDFIIVGSGPSGACLASRLAHTRSRPEVLLLEAGPAKEATNTDLIVDRMTGFVKYPSINWGYQSAPQANLNGRQVDTSRGKALGGSSAINLCVWTSGPKDDFERMAEAVGDFTFGWSQARERLKRIENYDCQIPATDKKYVSPDPSRYGHDGPVRICLPSELEEGSREFLEITEKCGLTTTADINDGGGIGMAVPPLTSWKGKRWTSASAYLTDPPSNLTILTDARAYKIVFQGKKAVGVVGNGTEYRSKNDVVLSCGAVDSPKLLMLSGIGPSEELQKHRIAAVHALPGVGQNLQDHFLSIVMWETTADAGKRGELFGSPERMQAASEQLEKDGTGPLSVMFSTLPMGFFKHDDILQSDEFKSLPANVKSHLEKPTVPHWELCGHSPPMSPFADPTKFYRTLALVVQSPQSRGTISLQSNNPEDAPIIDQKLLSHPFDRRLAIESMRRTVEFGESTNFPETIVKPFMAPKSKSDEDILQHLQETGATCFHPSCSVKMGKTDDDMACVGTDFKVYGTENLRVVDLSVVPYLPNCHPVSWAYLMGETAAEKMISEYDLEA